MISAATRKAIEKLLTRSNLIYVGLRMVTYANYMAMRLTCDNTLHALLRR